MQWDTQKVSTIHFTGSEVERAVIYCLNVRYGSRWKLQVSQMNEEYHTKHKGESRTEMTTGKRVAQEKIEPEKGER